MKRFFAGALGAVTAIAALSSGPALAHDDDDAIRADGHAPIGVMGDHLHRQDEFMFSYRFMNMSMEGSRIGTNRVSPAQ
ncbi:MAG: transporter, partial [Pseudomonadota bacterium]